MSVPDLAISRAASTPSISGIEKSITIKSGASWCAFLRHPHHPQLRRKPASRNSAPEKCEVRIASADYRLQLKFASRSGSA